MHPSNGTTALALRDTPHQLASYRDHLRPGSLTELMEWAEFVQRSQLVPKNFFGKPADIVTAVQFGAEVGLSPMQALQGVALINGKAGLYGDAFLGVAISGPAYVRHKEWFEGEGETLTAHAAFWRKGNPDPFVAAFSVADAKRARLWSKSGPWTEYPRRMLQMRARGFAARDAFPDSLRGIQLAEELMDFDTAEVVSVQPVSTPHASPPKPATERVKAKLAAQTVSLVEVTERIAQAETEEELLATGELAKKLSKGDREKAKAAYIARGNEIRAAAAQPEHDAETGEVHQANFDAPAEEREPGAEG